ASMMSTPRSWSLLAIRTFSVRLIEQPGDCSPSRKVVSKMLTRFCGMGFPSCGQATENATEGWAKSQSYNLYRKIKIKYQSYRTDRTYCAGTSEIFREYSANCPV